MAAFVILTSFAPTILLGDGRSFGAYPMHGGNNMKQQIALDSNIDTENIHTLDKLCTFSQNGSWGYTGYPVVDNDGNAYFTDNAGYKSMDIATCTLNWEVTNYRADVMAGIANGSSYASLNTPSLIVTDSGDEAVLFGHHQWWWTDDFYMTKGCYILALRVEDGSMLYLSTIVDKEHREAAICIIHGVMVDGQYAYGGTSNSGYGFGMESISWTPGGPHLWRGKAFKMDINTGEVVAEWYSMPEYESYNKSYLETELSLCALLICHVLYSLSREREGGFVENFKSPISN